MDWDEARVLNLSKYFHTAKSFNPTEFKFPLSPDQLNDVIIQNIFHQPHEHFDFASE